MMIKNNRKRNFNELDWYNPFTWFNGPGKIPDDFGPTTEWRTLPTS